jgi:hypothetical protein
MFYINFFTDIFSRVLKAIDLGGCMLLPNHLAENPGSGERQERLDRMTSTFYIMAPEMDQIWLTKRHDHLKGLLEKANKNKTTEGIEEEFREVFEEEIKVCLFDK